MNPVWLVRNVARSWSDCLGYADVIRRLLLLYSARLPAGLRRRDWSVGFRYPAPIGIVRLVLRANNGADCFIHSEVFEHECYRVPLARNPVTVLDLGANIGLSTIYFARRFPGACLACVEPMPENLDLLQRNLRLNSVQARIISAAVHVTDGNVRMRRCLMDYAHKISSSPENSCTEELEVPALTVPSLLKRLGWSRIGLLKLDVEGHERGLLSQNCNWLHLVDAMCLEWHDETGETELKHVAQRFGFHSPQRLPHGIWLLARDVDSKQQFTPNWLRP